MIRSIRARECSVHFRLHFSVEMALIGALGGLNYLPVVTLSTRFSYSLGFSQPGFQWIDTGMTEAWAPISCMQQLCGSSQNSERQNGSEGGKPSP